MTIPEATKKHVIMVYPANGACGYEATRDLVQGAKSSMHERILAVCASTEGSYIERLRQLGKSVEVITLKNPSEHDHWKDALKNQKEIDVVAIIADPSAARHLAVQTSSHHDVTKILARGLENCVEFSAKLRAQAIVVTNAYLADDSKYSNWHELYNVVRKNAEKHEWKNGCTGIFHQPAFEIMKPFSQRIKEQKELAWPVDANAKFTPLSLRCLSAAVSHVIERAMTGKLEEIAERKGKHHELKLTGKDVLTPQGIADLMSQNFNESITYKQIDDNEARNEMKDTLSEFEAVCFLEAFKMIESGKMDHATSDYKKVTGKEPEGFGEWLTRHQDEFAPGGGMAKSKSQSSEAQK